MVTLGLRWLALGSLALLVVMTAWQIRSYWHRDFLLEAATFSYITSESGRAVVVLNGFPRSIPSFATRAVGSPREYVGAEVDRIGAPYWGDGLKSKTLAVGFAVARNPEGRFVVIAPHALFGIIVAVPAVWLWRRRIRAVLRARAESGVCIACGYDLRGSPSERCPECGASRLMPAQPSPQ